MGADNATGVDIDKLAVKTAIENGKVNGFEAPKYNILNGNLVDKVTGTFDVVVANIVADIIIRMLPDVEKFLNPGGILITSGIIEERAEEVLKAALKTPLEYIEEKEEKSWCAMVFKMRD